MAPIISKTLEKCYEDSAIVDKVCTFIRTIMRQTTVAFIPYLNDVILLLEQYYNIRPSCGLLYPIGIMGELYASYPEYINLI